jgi:flagellar hook-associated protein 2
MSVNFLGIGSGLNLQSMLDQLVQVATEPKVQQLGAKEVEVNASVSGAGAIRSALSSFQDKVDDLKSSSLYGQKNSHSYPAY